MPVKAIRRLSALLGILLWISKTHAAAEPTAEADIIGIWRVEPSTYEVVPRLVDRGETGKGFIVRRDGSGIVFSNGVFDVKTNIPLIRDGSGELMPGRVVYPSDTSMPTNFMVFALELKSDGSFVATNIPPDFFFHWPSLPEARGRWALHTHKNLVLEGEHQSLSLLFENPRSGVLERPLSWRHTKPAPARQFVLHLLLGEDRAICLARRENAYPTNRPSTPQPGHGR